MLHRRLTVVFFIALAVLWLSARIRYFNGYYTEDAPGYVSDAIALARGDYGARNHVNGLNIGTYAPVAVPLTAFGKSDVALSIWPLLSSLIGVASVAGICVVLFGRIFGALAAALYATYPGDVFFSTVVMPDAIQAGWLSLAMLLVVLAFTRVTSHASALLLAAGATMGVCHVIRANGGIFLPVGLVAIVVFSKTSAETSLVIAARRAAVFLVGWAMVFAVEGLAYFWTVGDFLFRLHVVNRHYGSASSIAQWGLNTHPLTIPYSAFAPLTWARWGGWGTFNQDQAYHGLLFTWAFAALVLGAAVLVWIRRARQQRTVAALMVASVWFAWPLMYHQFGSQSLTQFVPIHRLSRHLVVYAPGAIVAAVAGCAIIWSAVRSTRLRTLFLVLGIAILGLHLRLNIRAEHTASSAYREIKGTYTRIRDRLPADTRLIVADPGDLGFLDFWLNPLDADRVRLVPFANYSTCAELGDGVVLTFSNPGWHGLNAPVIQETVARLPCLLQPPRNWRLLYQGFPEKVYLIGDR